MKNKWDRYFYSVAKTVSENSECLSRKIGAVLVKDKSIISTGYNGPPRGVPHCSERIYKETKIKDSKLYKAFIEKEHIDNNNIDQIRLPYCPRKLLGFKSGGGLEYCIASHAERSALINAGRNGISTYNTKLYLTCETPCKDCLIEIINAGVEEIIIVDKLSFYDETSKFLVSNSNINIREYV